jgi:DNA-binding NtrC family response regulator
MKKLLVVDDDLSTCEFVRELLADVSVEIDTCRDPRKAIVLAEEKPYDIVLSDVNFDKRLSGIDVLKAIKSTRPESEVILMSAFGSLDTAIEAVRQGAFDFVSKPFDVDEVRRTVVRALDASSSELEARPLPASLAATGAVLVGSSPKMLAVYKSIALVAGSKTSVLIQGESGTGKELVARAIHGKGSRSTGPFVAVHCGALTETLLESELFGYVKGAFTGASTDKEGLFHAANKGTIFLDEISETSSALQIKLLRVLQEEEYTPVGSTQSRKTDVRVIAASNQNLEALVREGGFREDLLYRLNVVTIVVPPLRERPEDIPKLIAHFVHRLRASGAPPPRFSAKTLDRLIHYPWPGNVRELENTIERLALFSRGHQVEVEDLPEKFQERASRAPESLFDDLPPLDEIERRYLIHVLARVGGNRKRAAEVMGIDRRTLYRMMERFNITDDESRPSDAD